MTASVQGRAASRLTAMVVLAGHAGPAITQLLIFALLGQVYGSEILGTYVLALAVATPVFVLLGLSLRMIYMTAETAWSVTWFLRCVGLVAVVCTVIAVAAQVALGIGVLLAAAVAAGRALDLVQMAGLGVLQRNDRLRFGSVLLIGNAVLSCALAGLAATASLSPATIVSASAAGSAVFAAATWASVVRHHLNRDAGTANIVILIRRGFPLGLSVGLLTLTISLPAYALDAADDLAAVAIYGILSSLRTSMNMVYGTVAQIFIGRFTSAVRSSNFGAFRQGILRALFLTMTTGTGIGLLLVIIGPTIVPRIFGVDTDDWNILLAVVGVGFVASGAIYVFDAALSSLQKYSQQAWTAAFALLATGIFILLSFQNIDIFWASVMLSAAFCLSAGSKGFILHRVSVENFSLPARH